MTAGNTTCARRLSSLAIVCWISSSPASQEIPFVVECDGPRITMTVNLEFGLPAAEFVKLAKGLTGKNVRYEKDSLADKRVFFAGKARISQREFPAFFQTIFYRLGFECVSRGSGDVKQIELLPIKAKEWRVSPVHRVEYWSASNLATLRHRSDLLVVTSIPVLCQPSTRVAELMARRAPRGVQIGRPSDGKSIILQGPGDAVYKASQVCAAIDRKGPPNEAIWLKMVPQNACAAAAFDLPVKDALTRILDVALRKEGRNELDQGLLATGAYRSTAALIDGLHVCLEPRLGIVLRPNVRTASAKESFPVKSDHKCPQWAFVFQIRQNKSGKLLSAPCSKLISVINENRPKFGITTAFKLGPAKGVAGPIFEFARPDIPGTGCLSLAVVGDRFVVGNSGTLLYGMFSAAASGLTAIRGGFRDAAKKRDKTRGAVWLDRTRISELIQALGRKDSIEVLEQGELVRWMRLAFGN